jgi:hypothetical protein
MLNNTSIYPHRAGGTAGDSGEELPVPPVPAQFLSRRVPPYSSQDQGVSSLHEPMI